MTTMSISLCFPDEEKSCFACCPPIRSAGYEHIDHKNIMRRILRENVDFIKSREKGIIPITGFSCWGLGYIHGNHKLIGCMLHPFQNNGIDMRYRIDYGDKCRRETCEEGKVFSRLSGTDQIFWLGLSNGFDSFEYSSRKINPLFRMLGWGTEILSFISGGENAKPVTRESFYNSYPFFLTILSPKGNAYPLLWLLERNGVQILEHEGFGERYENFLNSLLRRLSTEISSTSCEPFTHLLDIDPLFADFLRLSASFSRINANSSIRMKDIVDIELEKFQKDFR